MTPNSTEEWIEQAAPAIDAAVRWWAAFADWASGHAWLAIVIPVLVIGGWVLFCHLLAAMSGWRKLALDYEARSTFIGETHGFRSAQFAGRINYNACLRFGANRRGLYIAPALLIRPGHSPLLIPWHDVRAREDVFWLFKGVALEFARKPGIDLRISNGLADLLLTNSKSEVVIEPYDRDLDPDDQNQSG